MNRREVVSPRLKMGIGGRRVGRPDRRNSISIVRLSFGSLMRLFHRLLGIANVQA